MDDKGVLIKFGRNKQFQTLISEDQVERIKGKSLKQTSGYVLIVENGKRRMLSHFVSGKPATGFVKDHINHNTLDNRNSNLRNASYSENSQNIVKRDGCVSAYKGVNKKKNCRTWSVRARKLDVVFQGSFDTEIEAAKAYDKFCWRLYPNSMTKDMTNNLLNNIEIEFAKNNDPPLSRQKAKQRILAKGVTKCRNSYRVTVINEMGKLQHFGTFNSIEAANQKAKEIQDKVANAKRTKLEKIPITMNEFGEAYIIAGQRTKNPTYVFVDLNLWHDISKHSWHISRGYVRSNVNKRVVTLHRFVWNKVHKGETIPEDLVIDHINGNKADCRSQNLRAITKSENAHNKKKRKDCSSSFIGVEFSQKNNKWKASCNLTRKKKLPKLIKQQQKLHSQIVINDLSIFHRNVITLDANNNFFYYHIKSPTYIFKSPFLNLHLHHISNV